MDEEKLSQIFIPDISKDNDNLLNSNLNLAYYTSAGTLFSILKYKQLWLRSTMCMNDYQEIKYAFEYVKATLYDNNSTIFSEYIIILEKIMNLTEKEIIIKFNELVNNIFGGSYLHTYIMCFSEHDEGNFPDGNLQMFNSYGRGNGACVIFDKERLKDLYLPIFKVHFNLSVAALLHDVGHAPLSHLGEKYFNVRKIKKAFEVECDSRNIAYKDICACKGAAPHELMSCYIIVKYFYNIILQEKAKEYDVDFELICRMIVGATYNTDSKWFEDLAIGVLNSSTIDMDKLDYIIRDPLMTGISVPRIDVTRFFRGLKYKKETHKVVILKQAITVVQNIIDTRDCLYLLVCNHHVTVYTDFIIEFYIKHLMLMHDKGQLAITEDSLDANDYFSCDAIGEKLVTDGDLLCKLKEYYNKNKNFSPYTQVITPQIFERKFLAPLWKDLYSFNMFQEKYIGDTYKIEDMLKKMCDNEDYIYRRYIAREINNKLKLTHGNIFIVPRSNKFYMDNPNNKFYIYVNDCLKKISELLPQKYYGNLHSGAAFYVYGPKEHINEVREAFVEVIKRGLPSKDKIDYPESIPNWLKDSKDD